MKNDSSETLAKKAVSFVRETSVPCQMTGEALAAGSAANQTDQEPAASALPLTYFSNGA
jgi:hypothetical protein